MTTCARHRRPRRLVTGCLLAGMAWSCQKPHDPFDPESIILDNHGAWQQSTSAGNLMATAMIKTHNLDMAFYPTAFLNPTGLGLLRPDMDEDDWSRNVFELYDLKGKKDVFYVGSMTGAAIKDFLLRRTMLHSQLDLQVAGVCYQVILKGGFPLHFEVGRPGGETIDDDKLYRVAVSKFAFGPPDSFPGYMYRNGLQYSFRQELVPISAQQSLVSYLQSYRIHGDLQAPRGQLKIANQLDPQLSATIQEIQGLGHVSPLLGRRVTTNGVITAVAAGTGFFIQNQSDHNPHSSDGIYVDVAANQSFVKVGSRIEITATVYEDQTNEGLSRTTLRDIERLELLAEQQPLPEAVIIGPDGRLPPHQKVSSYIGNVNQRPQVNLNDGLGFWESLEGMRVKVSAPVVVGVAGGKEDLYDRRAKSYLNIFVATASQAVTGRLVIDGPDRSYHPEIIMITNNPFSPQVKTTATFNVGDHFGYDLEGIFTYALNNFNSGEYSLYVTGDFNTTSPIVALDQRPITPLQGDEDHLTIASYNVENLGGNETDRIAQVATVIAQNLRCPDIINLVEVMDFNGINFEGDASAAVTLATLIEKTQESGCIQSYRALNIDPIVHQEGGKPGGNIRVAMLYNPKRVSFESRGQADRLKETLIYPDGSLSQNPGRVYPNDPAFKDTRKPLIAQFSFHGQRLFVIGNHFNSKGGDLPSYGAKQPAIFHSESHRSHIAKRVHNFIQRLQHFDPSAGIIVLGDFNELYDATPMKILKGSILKNLIDSCPLSERYTFSFRGNSQALDYLMVSQNLYHNRAPDFDILHINTDYMAMVSDHDPIVTRLSFAAEPEMVTPCRHKR